MDLGTKEESIDDVGSENEDKVSRRLGLQVKGYNYGNPSEVL